LQSTDKSSLSLQGYNGTKNSLSEPIIFVVSGCEETEFGLI